MMPIALGQTKLFCSIISFQQEHHVNIYLDAAISDFEALLRIAVLIFSETVINFVNQFI